MLKIVVSNDEASLLLEAMTGLTQGKAVKIPLDSLKNLQTKIRLQTQTKAPIRDRVMSTSRFIIWIDSFPKDTVYKYTDPEDCLIARYLRDWGRENITVSPNKIEFQVRNQFSKLYVRPGKKFVSLWDQISRPEVGEFSTYGEALNRALKLPKVERALKHKRKISNARAA